ncbi:dimethylamine monooxygenase subunit DmmA family protein [Mycobacterium sp. SMC-4]|uniref:dimethylamine monooxygenase subunit DmmA family protein n=1 Tax=Mycobacterium sp. SMC-4 TaxID=2857059 RepID=UPI003CFE43CE
MRPALELTSVPVWATTTSRPAADLSGRSWTIIAIGADGIQVARQWQREIGDSAVDFRGRIYELADDGGDAACEVLRADSSAARVGWRLMVAGPAHACLKVRAEAVTAGVADDEITVATTETNRRAVQCAHCRTVTVAVVDVEEVVVCDGCARNLFVHYHVSRRQGAHLGYMLDAEEQVAL